MNLYRIIFAHYSQSSSETGIKTYLLADNDEQIFYFIDKKYNCEHWTEENETLYDKYGNELNGPCPEMVILDESYKDKIIRVQGDFNDDEFSFSGIDLYYGWTLYGWEIIEGGTDLDVNKMIKLGLVIDIR